MSNEKQEVRGGQYLQERQRSVLAAIGNRYSSALADQRAWEYQIRHQGDMPVSQRVMVGAQE